MAADPGDVTSPRSGSGRRGRALIEIVRQRFLTGPNLHADRSAVVVTLRGGNRLALLSRPAPPGMGALAGCEALRGGAELAALVAGARRGLDEDADGWALALAIAEHAQADCAIEPARGWVLGLGDGEVELLVPADSLKLGVAALQLGCVVALDAHGPASGKLHERAIAQRLQFAQVAHRLAPDQSTLAVARKAVEFDIPIYFPGPNAGLIQLGQGRHARLATETVLDPQSGHALRIARDKWATLTRLRMLGLPALPSALVAHADAAVAAAAKLGGAVVVKPAAGGKGHGVTVNLTDEGRIRRAFALAARYGGNVLVEKFAAGEDHRLTVVNGRMVAAAKRVAASVTGDGRHTVRELIEVLNADPRRGPPFEKLMEYVQIDERLEALLAQQGLSLDAVPADGVEVKASLAANISQGGTAIDVTDIVHPDNRAAVEVAARACHALIAGVDFFTPDIGTSWREGQGWILEVNTSPGLRPHWIANPADDLMEPVLRVAFPEGAPARVPTAGITGSVGKTTTCQMVAQIARAAGRHPALNTTQGTWSGDAQLKIGDFAGGAYTAELLTDPAVDMAIAELARGGLIKGGMAIDAIDVAAVLNLGDNHVGLDGIATREELARVKAIPVRRAREWVFLCADDLLVLGLRDQMGPGVRLGLVSRNPDGAALAAHRADGGCTVTLDGSGADTRIVIRQGEEIEFALSVSDIPASEGGTSPAIIENAMFAAAIALRLGLSPEEVAAGLGGFTSDARQNPGRHNRIEGLPFGLLLTWVDGTTSLDELIARLEREKREGPRHLYIVVPGNRTDAWMIEMGRRAAGHFDRYWCAELVDLRGRAPGEAARLVAQGLREGGVAEEAITCLAGAERAMGPVLAQVEPAAHMTLMVYDTATVLSEIEAFREGLPGG